MSRYYFTADSQPLFIQARFDSVVNIGKIANDQNCEFIVVCGDVFESNQVSQRTIDNAVEALNKIKLPTYILPGNHDPHDASSVYTKTKFPDHVHIILDSNPVSFGDNVEIVGAPWFSKQPDENLFSVLADQLEPVQNNNYRICVAHGAVDILVPNRTASDLIKFDKAKSAIDENVFQYIALGDKHSTMHVGGCPQIMYSGSPEPTDFRETDSGNVVVVDLAGGGATTETIRVGKWYFIKQEFDINSSEDIGLLEDWYEQIVDKSRTVVRLKLRGGISLVSNNKLEKLLETHRNKLAVLDMNQDQQELVIIPEDEDFDALNLSGFAENTKNRLVTVLDEGPPEKKMAARDALALLMRLSGENQ
jgi:DNA repair exonuclease SbcCD nuclease subunit